MLVTTDRIALSLATIDRCNDNFLRSIMAVRRSRRRIRSINGGSAAAPLGVLSGLTIVVIENDPDNRDMLATYLRHCGARVAPAGSRQAAFAYLRTGQADVVITDVSVVESAGVEFVTELRQVPHHKDTPVVALTGWPQNDARVANRGFTASLQKPIDPEALAAMILGVLRVRLIGRLGEF